MIVNNNKTIDFFIFFSSFLIGDWISRTILERWKKEKNDKGEEWPENKGGKERGKDYNHSTFCDLIINGLIGNS